MILSVVLERVLQQLFFSLLFSTRVNVIHIFFPGTTVLVLKL